MCCERSGIPPKMFLCQIFIWSCHFQCQTTGLLSFLFCSVLFCSFLQNVAPCCTGHTCSATPQGLYCLFFRFVFLFHHYHDIVFYFLRLLVTIRANFLQAQWRPNNRSSLMRQSPFRDAYLRSSQSRNCTETEVRCSSPTQHTYRENVTPVSSQIHYWQGMASPSL